MLTKKLIANNIHKIKAISGLEYLEYCIQRGIHGKISDDIKMAKKLQNEAEEIQKDIDHKLLQAQRQ